MPGAHHLVLRHQAGDTAIADGYQEAFIGYRRQLQHPGYGLVQRDYGDRPLFAACRGMLKICPLMVFPRVGLYPERQSRCFAKDYVKRHVDGVCAVVPVGDDQPPAVVGRADDCMWRPLPFTDGTEALCVRCGNGQHVTFLGFVAPQFHGGHTLIGAVQRSQVEDGACFTLVHQFRQRVGQTAGAHVVDGQYRVFIAQRPALIYDFLATALYFRVIPLYRREVQFLAACARCHRGGGPAAEADEHGRAAQHDDFTTRRQRVFVDVARPDNPVTAGQHDGFMVSPGDAGHRVRLFEGAEITGQGRAAELVIV